MTEKKYSNTDRFFAWISFILGYFFIRWCFLCGVGIGFTAVALCLLVYQVIYFIITIKKKPDLKTVIAFIITLTFSAGFCLTASPLVLFFNFILFALGYIYVFYRACGNGLSEFQGEHFFFDIIKSIFVVPLCNLDGVWNAIFKKTQEQEKEGKGNGSIVIGLLIAIIPVCIVTALLSSDTAFSIVLGKIFKFDAFEIAFTIFCFALGIPAAMYFFGIIYGNAKYPMPEILSSQKADEARKKVQVISPITAYATVIPLLLLYAFFFASQCIYFISALQKMLPQDFSLAQYARRGFFELCAVCVINFIVICLMNVFVKKSNGDETRIGRTIKAFLCIFTEALIVIDIAKMLLYITEYGLTQKRVVTSWFMILLGLLFLLLFLKQIFPRFKISIPAATIAVILSAILIFGNIDSVIASYNVSAYKSKKLATVDISAMYTLDDSAVQFVLPLVEDPDYDISTSAESFLISRAESIKYRNLNEYTLSTFKAKKLLKEKGYIN